MCPQILTSESFAIVCNTVLTLVVPTYESILRSDQKIKIKTEPNALQNEAATLADQINRVIDVTIVSRPQIAMLGLDERSAYNFHMNTRDYRPLTHEAREGTRRWIQRTMTLQ